MRRIPDGPGSLLKLPCASAPVTELGAGHAPKEARRVHDLAKPARIISRAATLGKTQDFDQLNAMIKCNCNDVPYANGTTGRMHALAIDADMSRCREGGCS
jgi:hypothetical protein